MNINMNKDLKALCTYQQYYARRNTFSNRKISFEKQVTINKGGVTAFIATCTLPA